MNIQPPRLAAAFAHRLRETLLPSDWVSLALYPPYNIEKAGDDAYRIVMAVAGFGEADLNIAHKESELLVTGQTAPNGEAEKEYLYRGIAGRNFERRFQLADHVKVVGAKLANGLLSIELKREIPEEKKARAIRIGADAPHRTITQQ